MAFAIPPTFAEVRRSVAIRARLGAKADASNSMREMIAEAVRSATAYLYLHFNQAQLRIRVEADLITDQSKYDWPDNIDPGKIGTVTVVRSDGYEYELVQGITHDDRNQYTETGNTSLPVRYQIINEEIELLPSPDADTYPTLRIEGFGAVLEPEHDDDRIPFDKEAIVSMSEAMLKKLLKSPDYKESMSYALDYMEKRRGVDAPGGSFNPGDNTLQSPTFLRSAGNVRRRRGFHSYYRGRSI